MNKKKEAWYVGRRAELLAELFLQELGPHYLAQASGPGSPFDFLATFVAPDGTSKSIGIEVKATQREFGSQFPLLSPENVIRGWRNSNIPVLLLVVDVKRSRFFFNWAREIREAAPSARAGRGPRGFVIPLREATDEEKECLKSELLGDPAGAAAKR